MRRRLMLDSLDDRIVPTFFNNQLFPLDNPWNQVISAATVAANSDAIMNRILGRHGDGFRIHADWGDPEVDPELWGIPVNVVDNSVPKVNVVIPSFGYPGESDIVQVPIPAGAVIEGDDVDGPALPQNRGDSHLLIYNKSTNLLYELYQAVRPNETRYPYGGNHPTGQWGAWQISFWDLNDNSFRTIGATSADAAGLPILPGLVRPDEAITQGAIRHAIRVTMVETRNEFVFPASHEASDLTGNNLPRMGERFRLRADYVIPSTWSTEAKAMAQAMKDYGLIVADNGSDFFFQGEASPAWNMSLALQIQQIEASNFEVVDLSPVVTGLSTNNGSTLGGATITVSGYNFSGAAGELHVLFGNVEATSVTILSDTQLSVVVPAHSAGTVDVRVQSGTNRLDTDDDPVFFGYGTSPVVAAGRFTFAPGQPPIASPDSYSVSHDRLLSVPVNGVLGNDESNPVGQPLTASVVAKPTHGTLTFNANGSFTYKPFAKYVGIDSFTYIARDVVLTSPPVTVTIDVLNHAPTATDDTYLIASGLRRAVVAPGVLANDTDVDGDTRKASLVTGPTHGTLLLYANGSFAYTPTLGYVGNDSFVYRVTDVLGTSATATANLAVLARPQVKSIVINDGSSQHSLIRSITVTFDTLVTLDAGAIALSRVGGGAPTQTRQIINENGETKVILTFKGSGTAFGSLNDGNWVLRVIRGRIHHADYRPAIMAADRVEKFHRLFGDSDGDRDVDGTDRTAFDGGSLATFDYDNDGDVDAADQLQFNKRFGRTI